MLRSKKVLLAVTGSIAAYKAAHLVRLLVKQGAEVKVLLSSSAKEFITPLTLSTLSKNPVLTDFLNNETGLWNNHVELGLWADVMIIAPATAKTLSSMANGYADNLIIATYLSAKCPVFFAPAMDLDMHEHPSTIKNINQLVSFGNHLIPAGEGELASGLSGKGRMAEPEDIVQRIATYFTNLSNGVKLLITAGPTYEAIDPVRFIGNHSSGKMGFAIAQEAVNRGYAVVLITGPTHLEKPAGLSVFEKVSSAKEMFEAVEKYRLSQNVFIMAAAVADYTPKEVALQKIKKTGSADQLNIELQQTKDILAYVGNCKSEKQLVVGFALETENAEENALKKLKKKNADIIVLNSLENPKSGFGHTTNQITILDNNGGKHAFDLKEKALVAKDILDYIHPRLKLN